MSALVSVEVGAVAEGVDATETSEPARRDKGIAFPLYRSGVGIRLTSGGRYDSFG